MNNMHKSKQTEIGMIPEEWEVKKIKEVGKVVTGKTPPTSNKRYFDGKYPFIRIPDMGKSVFVRESELSLSEEGAKYMKKLKLPQKAVMVSCLATIGQVGITAKESFTNQQINSIIPYQDKIISEWIYYFFKSNKSYLDSFGGGGSVYTNISKSKFENIVIPIPPLSEQRAIAKILSDLDAKIELNQKMNKTLEEIGQALFKHWFVDFEFPNEEGKPYKSSGGEMVYNEELGKEIPKVWEVSNIGKELKTILGGTPSRERKEYWINGNIPWINSGEINKFPIIDATEYITPDALKNSATQLMPKRTVVLPFVISINKQISISILGTEVCGNQSVLGIVEKQGLPSEYIYYWVEHMKKDIYSWATGGAQQHINKTNVDKTKILIPSKDVMQNYSRIVRQIFDLVIKNSLEVKTLSQIRDVLLPKLMSGKIRVPLEEENG